MAPLLSPISSIVAYLLPAEVWLACWMLCSVQQLGRISLVCRLFRSLTIPLLLQHQTFDVAALEAGIGQENWIVRVRHLRLTAVRLDRLVEGSFPSLVRSWKVTFKRPRAMTRDHPDIHNMHSFDRLNNRVVTTFVTTLSLYQNLSCLHLRQATIEDSFREALLSLPKLEEFLLHNCTIRMWPAKGHEILQIVSPGTLRTLDAGEHISHLIGGFGSETLHRLVHLSMSSVHDVEGLFRFFRQCPQLEYLAIKSFPSRSILPTIHPNTIPRLRTITAPPSLIQLLTPNRPFHGVTILEDRSLRSHDTDQFMRVCMDISHTSAPLHSLALPSVSPTLEFLLDITSLSRN